MLGKNMVRRMKGMTVFAASFNLCVSPHIMPKVAKRNPDSPMVGSLTHVGRKLARDAMMKAGRTAILFLMFHNTMRLMARWKTLA
jgi:hypothetical protein